MSPLSGWADLPDDCVHVVMDHLVMKDIHRVGACDRASRRAMLAYVARTNGRKYTGGRELLLREVADECEVMCVRGDRIHASVTTLRLLAGVILPSFTFATKLTTLVLDGLGLHSAELAGLPPTLTALSLRDNYLTSLTSLERLDRLTNLDLTRNQIKDTHLVPVSRMTGLEYLSLRGNQLFSGSLWILRTLTSLKFIDCGCTHMVDASKHLTHFRSYILCDLTADLDAETAISYVFSKRDASATDPRLVIVIGNVSVPHAQVMACCTPVLYANPFTDIS